VIRVDSIWLATEPMDMRAGTETALARVVAVFGAAKPHCAYLFANRRANRMKVLVHDGVGIWLARGACTRASFIGQASGTARKSNSTPSNFRLWYWGCPGSESAQPARSQCCSTCH